MGAWFLPSLRENVRVRANTVVNLTLNSLYEVMQWLPAEPRTGNAQKDDWAWTLRSAANRPLLRWLEDGPLVVVSDGSGAHPRLKARLVATGQEGAFGESGERISAAVEETPSNSRELLASVDFDPDSDAGMESMLGFRQDLGFAGSVQSVAAVALHPEMDAAGERGTGRGCAAQLGDDPSGRRDRGRSRLQRGAGAALPDRLRETVAALLPFASVGWRDGNSDDSLSHDDLPARRCRMPRRPRPAPGCPRFLPATAIWPSNTDCTRNRLGAAHRSLRHRRAGLRRQDRQPGHRGHEPLCRRRFRGDSAALLDPASGLLRAAGPDFSTAGVGGQLGAPLARRQSAPPQLRQWRCSGPAGCLAARRDTWPRCWPALHPRRAQEYSLSLSGTLDGTGTRWRASYRWQPEETVTQVAPFAVDAAAPYLNLHLRQPIHLRRDGSGSFEAVLDVRNLLAAGLPALSVERRLAADLRPGAAQHPRRPGLQLLEASSSSSRIVIRVLETSSRVCAIFFKGRAGNLCPAQAVRKLSPPHGSFRSPGRVAQLAEHSALNRQVVGSIPTASTIESTT